MLFKYVSLLLLLISSCRHPDPVSNAERRGTVDWVFDGDTIRVGPERVRLIGVDTPETEKRERPGRKGQKGECYADEATGYLTSRLKGKEVRLETDPADARYDKYGRLLAYVYLGDQLINRELVVQGFGRAIRFFPYQKKEEFLQLEGEAKVAGRGLWGACVRGTKK